VANRRATGATARSGGKSGSYSQHVVSLLSQRDRHVNEIALLRSRRSAASPFVRKAETLLTRYWGKADWQEREEILRTVRWLFSMARLETATPPANFRPAQRVRRRRSRMLAPA
jgi:hypothetical protein